MLTQKLILVVDDQAGIRALLAEALGQSGYRVETAATGAAALQILNRNQPDLVLLDLNMPEMSGLETLQALRRTYPALPVLMITADENDRNLQQATRLGICGRIVKPFDLDDLYYRIAQAID